MQACTVVGRGGGCPLWDNGSELRKGGSQRSRPNMIDETETKNKTYCIPQLILTVPNDSII